MEAYHAIAEKQGNGGDHDKLKAEIIAALSIYEETRLIWIQFYQAACHWTESRAPYSLICSSFGLEGLYPNLGEVKAAGNSAAMVSPTSTPPSSREESVRRSGKD